MVRVCWKLCRSRLAMATGVYILAILSGVVAIMVFLDQLMGAANQQRKYEYNNFKVRLVKQ